MASLDQISHTIAAKQYCGLRMRLGEAVAAIGNEGGGLAYYSQMNSRGGETGPSFYEWNDITSSYFAQDRLCGAIFTTEKEEEPPGGALLLTSIESELDDGARHRDVEVIDRRVGDGAARIAL